METAYKTRRELKKTAKQQLRQPGLYGDLIKANIVPWLINVFFAVAMVLVFLQLLQAYGFDNWLRDPDGFIDYYLGHSGNTTARTALQSLLLLWFGAGLNFTALDVTRGKLTRVSPLQALMRTFNSRYFFGLLLLVIVSTMLTAFGTSLFVIPGLMLSLGLAQGEYLYYDGREQDPHFGSMRALVGSWAMMRGFKTDFLLLELSIIGWRLLENVTLHLADLLIEPYLQLVKAAYYDNLRNFIIARAQE
ncbi:DUF975 family protein [Lacticaseibacillus yichunensis]|uniref:DUF975 family protein n=1 Tax=Lacticaseibacillus yichunensis TaxID=2486015 RepID=A0ABW4CSI9_9LACO|nr:DUF975 family protein [Lacticaseibacillus yichunensis]